MAVVVFVVILCGWTHLYHTTNPTQTNTQVSLFLLRFPPETLFELEDIAMDAAMDSFDDADPGGGSGPRAGSGDDGGRDARRGAVDEEGMLEEGVDLRLMGQLVPRFLGKVCRDVCRCVCTRGWGYAYVYVGGWMGWSTI